MGGLGHPNAIGRTGALAGLLCLALLRGRTLQSYRHVSTLMLLGIMLLSIATCFATFSRTALVSGLAGATFLLLDRLASRSGMAAFLTGALVIAFGFFAVGLVMGGQLMGEFALSVGTKTGTIEELTSATGRTEIWVEAVRRVQERPLTGWGLNSSTIVLEEFSLHTHNLLLHAALSGGLLAGFLVAALLLWSLVFGLISSEPLIRAVSIYVLISGLFEDTCLDTFASASTQLWLVVLLYPALAVGWRRRNSPIENESSSAYHGQRSMA
jgi:O-antigen ligase